jgi:hypothetical protein
VDLIKYFKYLTRYLKYLLDCYISSKIEKYTVYEETKRTNKRDKNS